MASAPLKIRDVRRGHVIMLIKELREIFHCGLREAKVMAEEPFPHYTPPVEEEDIPDVVKRLQDLGAVFDDLPDFKPSNPKNFWDRLGEDDDII
jgi:ribosomal protein L7/L12